MDFITKPNTDNNGEFCDPTDLQWFVDTVYITADALRRGTKLQREDFLRVMRAAARCAGEG